MKITQSTLKQLIAEELAKLDKKNIVEQAEEAASWAGPLIAMMAPMMGYYLYHWFAKQGEGSDRRLDEGMKMPDLPEDLLARIPDSPRDISAGLYAELMKHLPGLDTNDLRAINNMIANLVAAKKAQS